MKKLIIIASVLLLIPELCHAQSHIHVAVSSSYFDSDKRVYTAKRKDIEKGDIFVYSESKDTCMHFPIIDSSIDLPILDDDDFAIVILYYKHRYFYTKSFGMIGMTSNISQKPEWIFDIEESSLSKKMFGSYYFALTVPPIECGRVEYNNKCAYHHQGKKLLKSLRQLQENHRNELPQCLRSKNAAQ